MAAASDATAPPTFEHMVAAAADRIDGGVGSEFAPPYAETGEPCFSAVCVSKINVPDLARAALEAAGVPELLRRLATAETLHVPDSAGPGLAPFCTGCGAVWPCHTLRALTGTTDVGTGAAEPA